MYSCLLFAALCVGCLASPNMEYYSYSEDVGGRRGSPFSTEGQGRVTAIRVWEINSQYITGIQLRYNYIWSERIGREVNEPTEIELFDGETIVQVSGKYSSSYIYQLIFVTSMGRSLIVGQPTQFSFNFYPAHEIAELRLLSGKVRRRGITSLGAHWGAVDLDGYNNTDIDLVLNVHLAAVRVAAMILHRYEEEEFMTQAMSQELLQPQQEAEL